MSEPAPDDPPSEDDFRRVLWGFRDRLPMFTVYDSPTDLPGMFVARLWLTLPKPEATGVVIGDPDIDKLRWALRGLGLMQLMRSPGDEAHIMETWI